MRTVGLGERTMGTMAAMHMPQMRAKVREFAIGSPLWRASVAR